VRVNAGWFRRGSSGKYLNRIKIIVSFTPGKFVVNKFVPAKCLNNKQAFDTGTGTNTGTFSDDHVIPAKLFEHRLDAGTCRKTYGRGSQCSDTADAKIGGYGNESF
jgi:hypothetical protein